MIQTHLEKPQARTQLQNSPNFQARLPWLAGLGVSLLSLLIYLFTLSPTVNFVDSGELITVGVHAGIAHPPGYPLYTLLAIIGGALPFSDRAVGVNLISALAGALAVGLFYALVYEVIRYHLWPPVPEPVVPTNGRANSARSSRRAVRASGLASDAARHDGTRTIYTSTTLQSPPEWAAISVSAGAALLLGASFTFWDWATQAKMYTLHFAFVGGLLMLALRARRAVRGAGLPGPMWPPRLWPKPARLLVLLAFGLGLTFTNHFMSIALLPSLAVLIFWPQPLTAAEVKGRSVRPDAPLWRWLLSYIPWLMLAGLVPLLLYLYLPLRSAQQPLLNWGSPSTWGDFWRHVTLWEFRVSIGSKKTLFDFLGQTIGRAVTQLGPWLGMVILLLMIAGVVRLARTSLPLLVATALLVLFTLVETYNLEFAEIAAYSVPMYMMFIVWAAVGLHWLVVTAQGRAAPRQDQAQGSRVGRLALLAAAPLGIATLALIWNVGRAGHANDHLADAYVHNQFKSFAQNAVVITNNWYLASPSYYLQLVRHERPDVAIIDRKLLQYPYYLAYVTRQYPEVMATVKDQADPFANITRRWVDGEQVDSQQLSTIYFDMVHNLITRNLATGRPVYLQWQGPGKEEDFIAQGLSIHPEGLALRVDPQPFTGPPADPHFDLRGILTEVVPKDELAPLVIDDYPLALDRLANYARQTNHPTEATSFAAQASQVRTALGLPIH